MAGGKLLIESRRLVLRMRGLRVPLPPLVRVTLQEEAGCRQDHPQHVRVSITAPVLGEIYGYHGTFTYAVQPAEGGATASEFEPAQSWPDRSHVGGDGPERIAGW